MPDELPPSSSPSATTPSEPGRTRRFFHRFRSTDQVADIQTPAANQPRPSFDSSSRGSVDKPESAMRSRLQRVGAALTSVPKELGKGLINMPLAIGEGLVALPKELGNGLIAAATVPKELADACAEMVCGPSHEANEKRLLAALAAAASQRRPQMLAFTLMQWYQEGSHPLPVQLHGAARRWLKAVDSLTANELVSIARLRSVQESAPLLLKKLLVVFENQIEIAVQRMAALIPEELLAVGDIHDVVTATVERTMFPLVYETAINLYNDLYATQDQQIYRKVSSFEDLSDATAAHELAVPSEFLPVAVDLVGTGVLQPFLRSKTPSEKLEHLVQFLQISFDSLQAAMADPSHPDRAVSADDLVPFISLVMIVDQSGAPSRHLYSQVMFLTDFVSEATQMGLAGYAIVSFRHSLVRILALPQPIEQQSSCFVSLLEPKPGAKA